MHALTGRQFVDCCTCLVFADESCYYLLRRANVTLAKRPATTRPRASEIGWESQCEVVASRARYATHRCHTPATGCLEGSERTPKLARVTSIDFRVSVEPQQGASYVDQLAVAKAAEQLGFSAFHRSDHYVAMSGDGLPGPTDSWGTLAGLARETSTIRLGTMVTSATFRYPGPLAISVAQVDAMSGPARSSETTVAALTR